MDISYVGIALRRHWSLAILTALLLISAVIGYTLIMGESYTSYFRILATPVPAANQGSSADALRAAQIQARSFPGLLTSGEVLSPVIQELNLATSPGSLSRSIDGTVPIDSLYMDVKVSAHSAEAARAVGQSVAKHFVERFNVINESARYPSIKVLVVNQPRAPTVPTSPNWRLTVLGAGALGGLGGVLVPLVRWRMARHVQDAAHVTEGTDLRTLVLPKGPRGHDAVARIDSYQILVTAYAARNGLLEPGADPGGRAAPLPVVAVLTTGAEDPRQAAEELGAAFERSGIATHVIDASQEEEGSATAYSGDNAWTGTRGSPIRTIVALSRRTPVLMACAPVGESAISDACLPLADEAVLHVTTEKTLRSQLHRSVETLAACGVVVNTVIVHGGRSGKQPRR